ncbi:MAG: NADH-quinone oxidoreductase subunit NuoE family protein [Planctomycetota bacterium]|jgi:NADH:ubiquinone oxidoreductase subunit E
MNKELAGILKKNNGNDRGLIAVLEKIQAKYGFLTEEALMAVADQTGRSLVDVYGVATFYRAFTLRPRGKHVVRACLGTACHVRGGPAIVQELDRQLGIRVGDTTADREFTRETVNCLGACALAPVVVVDGHYFPKVETSTLGAILEDARNGLDAVSVDTDGRVFPVEVSCAQCNHSLMDERHPIDGHPSVWVTVSFGRKHCGLRLSCLYGSYNVSSEFEIPADTVVHMFCPHCHAELIGGTSCPECESSMVPMIVRGGGVVQICPRKGCKGHLLDLSEPIVE